LSDASSSTLRDPSSGTRLGSISSYSEIERFKIERETKLHFRRIITQRNGREQAAERMATMDSDRSRKWYKRKRGGKGARKYGSMRRGSWEIIE